MTPQEHLVTSSELAARSDQEFDQDGNRLIAAELLWGAVAHNFIAAADFHPDWQIHGHSYYAFVATQLSSAEPDTSWQADTAQADRLHRHFYNGDLSPADLATCRVAAKRLVNASADCITRQMAAQANVQT